MKKSLARGALIVSALFLLGAVALTGSSSYVQRSLFFGCGLLAAMMGSFLGLNKKQPPWWLPIKQ